MDSNISTWVLKFLILFGYMNFGGMVKAQILFDNSDTLQYNVPQENIEVRTETDENGNIISYDSSYSWSYYGDGSGSFNIDSMFGGFSFQFPDDDFFNMDPFFNFSFGVDTNAQYYDPFQNNFDQLFEMMEQHQRMMEEMFNTMPGFDNFDENEAVPPVEEDKTTTPESEQKNLDLKDKDKEKDKNFI